MAVDIKGYIALPEFRGFQPAFGQVVADTLSVLNETCGARIHSIYVYGSVAHARAKEKVSDLDVTLILLAPSDDVLDTQLASLSRGLAHQHAVISKVDIDVGYLQEVISPENSQSWGYWLKHQCICVQGEDLRNRFESYQPSRDIAVAINGDFMAVLNDYMQTLPGISDPAEKLLMQRAAARKAIRATSILRMNTDTDWPDSLQEHAAKFEQRYPALAEEMDYLLAMSSKPRGDIVAFCRRLQTFTYWLNAEFHSR